MAGSIEELHFEVILDHSKFDQEIKKVEGLAKSLNTEVSKILDLKKKIEAVDTQAAVNEQKIAQAAAKTAQAEEKVATQKEKTKTQAEKTATAAERHARAVSSTNTQLVTTQSLMSTIAQLTGVAFGVAGLRAFTSQLITITGQFEVQKMALTSMLQSADKADEIFNQLRKNALESPYTFADLTKFAKQLTAFNIPADKLVETEKMLADVAAAVGVDMGRIILAYGQVKAAGALKGQELRQFTEAGVPILEELAKQIEETEGKAISLSAVFDRISKKQIPFEMVEEAFRRMTSEGGKFYNMQAVLVETLQGKIGKLRDVWQQALYDLGQSNSTILKGAVDALTNLAGHLELIVNILVPVIAAFGAYKAALLLAATAQKALAGAEALGNLIKALRAAANGSRAAASALTFLASSSKAAAVGLVALVAVIGVELYRAYNKTTREMERFNEELDELRKSSMNTQSRADVEHLKDLKKIATDVNEAYEKRIAAIEILNGLEPAFNGHLKEQGERLQGNVAALDAYITKLEQKAKAEGYQAYQRSLYEREAEIKGEILDAQEELRKANEENEKNWREMAQAGNGFGYSGDAGVSQYTEKIKGLNLKLGQVQGRIAGVTTEITKMGVEAAKALGWGNDWSGNTIFKKKDPAVAAAEERIELLKQMRNAYERLLPYVGEDKIGDVLKDIFDPKGKNGYSYENLDQQILNAIDDLEKLGGEAAKTAAKLRSTFKFDVTVKGLEATKKATEEAAKHLENYYKILEKLKKSEGEVGVPGFGGKSEARSKVDTIVSQTNEGLKALVKARVSALEELKQAGKDEEEIQLEMAQIDEYIAKERENIWNRFANNLGGLTKLLFGEAMRDFDLTNFDDKTPAQLRAIGEALDNITLPEWLEKWLTDPSNGIKDAGATLTILRNLLKEMAEAFKTNTLKPEEGKKFAQSIRQAWGDLKPMLAAAKEFAPGFADSIDAVNTGVEASFKIAQRLAKGDTPGAIIAGVTIIATEIFKAATEAERLKQELEDAQEAVRHAAAMDYGSVVDVLFGEDGLAKLDLGIKRMGEANARMRELSDTVWRRNQMLNGVAENAGLDPSRFDYGIALGMMSKGLNPYDEYGNLNRTAVEQMIKLDEINASYWQKVLNAIDEYNEALSSVNEVTKELVGEMVDTAASTLIDQWVEAGNAALDYAEILDDVARAYAQMVVKQMILKAMPEGLPETLAGLIEEGNTEGFMAVIANAMQNIEAMAPYIEQALQAFDPYFIRETDEEGSLGRGIKSITEETASILASYLNAVRADVSVLRSIAERQEAGTMAWGESLPALRDYIQRIEAHTANTAENTASILTRINNVLNASGDMIRVEMN